MTISTIVVVDRPEESPGPNILRPAAFLARPSAMRLSLIPLCTLTRLKTWNSISSLDVTPDLLRFRSADYCDFTNLSFLVSSLAVIDMTFSSV